MEKIISVSGLGNISVMPDTAEIRIFLEILDKDFKTAADKGSAAYNELANLLKGGGIDDKALKTASYSINPKYKDEYDRAGKRTSEFLGFEALQTLILRLDFSNETLSKAVTAIINSTVSPRFSISFTARSVDKLKEKLIESAVKDAGKKAQTIAASANLKLLGIFSIDCSFNEIAVNSVTRFERAAFQLQSADANTLNLNIAPDNIVLKESVIVKYEFGN